MSQTLDVFHAVRENPTTAERGGSERSDLGPVCVSRESRACRLMRASGTSARRRFSARWIVFTRLCI